MVETMETESGQRIFNSLPEVNTGGVVKPKAIHIYRWNNGECIMLVTAPDDSKVRITIDLLGGVFEGKYVPFDKLWQTQPTKRFMFEIASGYYMYIGHDRWGIKVEKAE